MDNIPLVSIIMPLYNKRPYVRRAIESIQKQSYTNWELIIVDDGSTDGSSAEIPGDEPRIRLFQQENKGPGAARNKGIGMASGELVTFIDADDYYYPQKLEEEMDLLWKRQEAEWMISAFECELKNELRLQHIKDINDNEIKSGLIVFDNALKQLTVAGWHIDGLCIKKSLLNRVGGFREDMRYLEITELIIRCASMQPKVLIYQIPLYRVVDVPNSASKVSSHRNEAARQMGESLYEMSKFYPEFSNILIPRSRESLISYAAILILTGKGKEARNFLINDFPYSYNKRWWKMWIGSWIPTWMLRRLVKTDTDLNQIQQKI